MWIRNAEGIIHIKKKSAARSNLLLQFLVFISERGAVRNENDSFPGTPEGGAVSLRDRTTYRKRKSHEIFSILVF